MRRGVHRAIILGAGLAYLAPLLLLLLQAAASASPPLRAFYATHHAAVDMTAALLAASLGGGTALLVLSRVLRPWVRLEAALNALLSGQERLAPVGEAHADRVVARINALLEQQRDLVRLLELERARLARELHDGAIQSLLAARWALEEGDRDRALAALAEAETVLRAATRGLMPPALEHLPLEDALTELGERLGLAITARVEGALDPEARLEAYRIVQHALHNAKRHGEAGRAWVRVTGGTEVTVRVEDDGNGEVLREGQGLELLRARLRLLGGRLEWKRSRRGGTVLIAAWPRERSFEP